MLFNLLAADDCSRLCAITSRGIPAANAHYCAAAARLSLQRQHGLGPFAEVRSYDQTGGSPEHALYGLAAEATAAQSVLAAASGHDACTLGAAQLKPCLHKRKPRHCAGVEFVWIPTLTGTTKLQLLDFHIAELHHTLPILQRDRPAGVG